MAVSFVSHVWLARRFGPEGLGEYTATSVFLTVLTTLLLLGFPIAISERVASLHESRDTGEDEAMRGGLAVMLVLGTLASFAALASWNAFASVATLVGAAPAALIAAAALGAVLQSFVISVLLARLEMALATAIVLVQPLTVVLGLAGSYQVSGISGSQLGAAGFLAGGIASAGVLLGRGILPSWPRQETRRIARATVASTTALYLMLLHSWIDRLIVVVIAGPAALGAFAVASFLSEAILRIPRNAGSFGVSAYARLAGDKAGVRRVLDSQIRIGSAFFITAAALFLSAGNALLAVIFGEGFEVATTTLRLLAISLVPTGVALALAASAIGTGRHRTLAAVLVALVPLQAVLGSVGARYFGIAGVALAGLALWSVAVLILTTRRQDQAARPGDGTLLRVVGVAAPVLVAALVIGTASSLHWILRGSLSAGIALIVVSLVLVGPPERRILRRLGGQLGGDATA